MIDNELEKEQQAKFNPKAWGKVFGYLSQFKNAFILMSILVVFVAAIDTSFPLFTQYLIDNYIKEARTDGIWLFAALYMVFIAFQTFFIIFFLRKCLRLELNILEVLRNKIFKKFQDLSISYFNNRSVGYLVAKTMSDTERIGNSISWGFLDIGWNILYIAFMFVSMLLIQPLVAIAIMTIVPLSLFVSVLFERKLLRRNRIIRDINSKIAGSINEGITGAKTIKTLNAQQKLTDEFKEQTKHMCYETFKYNRLNAFYVSLLIFLGAFSVATVLSYGGYKVTVGGMTAGQLATFVAYASSLVNPVMQLAESLTNLVANQANVERTVNLLEEKPEIVDSPEVIEKYGDSFNPKRENWEEMKGEIEFRNVSFRYSKNDRYILKDFNLTIPAGSSLALVGETGAGKTTIVNLICRFYEPTEGQILIDGVDIRERSQLWLFSNLGYVLQTPQLFSGTVRSNLKFGRPDATDEEMEQAARLVEVDKVVKKLPQGYDTSIGECGDSLSTGEKQLFTFARAIIAHPKIIILDEATSSIDTHTESLVQHAITKVLEDRTSIMIAHRLSTIKRADKIVLIENGEIKESGSHRELMRLKGGYYTLYSKLFEEENLDKSQEALASASALSAQ